MPFSCRFSPVLLLCAFSTGLAVCSAAPAPDPHAEAHRRVDDLRRRLESSMARLQPQLDRMMVLRRQYPADDDPGLLGLRRITTLVSFRWDAGRQIDLSHRFDAAQKRFFAVHAGFLTGSLPGGGQRLDVKSGMAEYEDIASFDRRVAKFNQRLVSVSEDEKRAYLATTARLEARARAWKRAWTAAAAALLLAGGVLVWRWQPRPTVPPALGPGMVLEGNYTIERELGRGSASVVFEAVDANLGRRVAVKRMLQAAPGSGKDLEAFLRGAQAAAALKHPGIVEIYSILDDNGAPCLVLELVDGKPLSRVLAHGPLPLAAAKSVVRQVAAALDHAHGRGVLHGSLKPSNILCKADGTAKVTDFGIAPGEASKEADLMGLGDCARQMLTGASPQAGPALSTAADAFARKALHPDPLRRFRSAAELAAAFDSAAV